LGACFGVRGDTYLERVINVIASPPLCDRADGPEDAGPAPIGPHRLRHTAATEMLRAGASLPDIGQVLRHRRLQSTAVYARVDRDRLKTLALAWPEAKS
jgi:integrase